METHENYEQLLKFYSDMGGLFQKKKDFPNKNAFLQKSLFLLVLKGFDDLDIK